MATCKECIHYDICVFHTKGNENEKCQHFKTAADFVRCKDCEHGQFMPSCSMYLCRCTGGKLRYADDYCNYGERKEQE
jgi:hypothetical protein